MPAPGVGASLGPRSLELLYNKYGPDKLDSSSPSFPSSIPASKPTTSSSSLLQDVRKSRLKRPPPPVVRGRELGDLTKLGCELSKLERVHLLLDTPQRTGRKSQTHKPSKGQSKLKSLKSKLRLVIPRSLPDSGSHQNSNSPVRHHSQNVVPLPPLQIRFQRQASGSGNLPVAHDSRQTPRRMLFSQPNRSSAALWNFKTSEGSQPARCREVMDSTDASTRFLMSAGMPLFSSLGDCHDTETISTYDADRVDSEHFEYVFERFGSLSTESDSCTTVTPESDTATFSARAQRPSTTETVFTHQRLTVSRSSRTRSLSPINTRYKPSTSRESSAFSPITPRQTARVSQESCPPHYTVISSWPFLDDHFRFQYLGRGVHRDIMPRLHKSRRKKKYEKRSRDGDDETEEQQELPQQQQQQLQKLEIVVPTHTECRVCKTYECDHTTPGRL